jgi:hypothetical protein
MYLYVAYVPECCVSQLSAYAQQTIAITHQLVCCTLSDFDRHVRHVVHVRSTTSAASYSKIILLIKL